MRLASVCMAAAFSFMAAANEDGELCVAEGRDWIHLENLRDIERGSALDLSCLRQDETPAGRYGWLVSRNGHAEFERRPGVPARFYGVNLCTTANFLSDEEIERVTDRIAMLGYNAVRIHHHDGMWAADEECRRRLDSLVAACIRKGIYLTTDLYVSRRCAWRDLGVDRDGEVKGKSAKILMTVTDAGFESWKRFARAFLTRVNPHTGRSLAGEPAMPLITLINESSPHSAASWEQAKAVPEFRALWRDWLAHERAVRTNAYPQASADAFPKTGLWWNDNPESCAKAAFWAWCCGRFSRRAAKFLRDELKVRAMVATENHGPTLPAILKMRAECGDYVDFHMYTTDTAFATKAARDETGLPLKAMFRNANPLQGEESVYGSAAFNRVWGCPVIVSESQMSGPGFSRAVAGLATGTYAAVQDWTGLWTFALAHTREKLLDGADAPPGRYDLTLDPLMQATDRLPIFLFLRGDLTTPAAAFANDISTATFDQAVPSRPVWKDPRLAWRARLGVSFDGEPLPVGVVRVGGASGPSAVDVPSCGVEVDVRSGSITVSGCAAAGGFAGAGETFNAGALAAAVRGHRALVAAASLDGRALGESKRLLVWHLTDLHGDGFRSGGRVTRGVHLTHTGVLSWGSARTLLRAGEADVSLSISGSAHAKVWAIDTSGRRRNEVPCRIHDGKLAFTASARQPFGGCLHYEIERNDEEAK